MESTTTLSVQWGCETSKALTFWFEKIKEYNKCNTYIFLYICSKCHKTSEAIALPIKNSRKLAISRCTLVRSIGIFWIWKIVTVYAIIWVILHTCDSGLDLTPLVSFALFFPPLALPALLLPVGSTFTSTGAVRKHVGKGYGHATYYT